MERDSRNSRTRRKRQTTAAAPADEVDPMTSDAALTPTAASPIQSQITSASIKAMAADPKTTNLLLLVLVLCVSGYMPEQLMTLCGA